MTSLDARLIPRIAKILNKYGKTVTFTWKDIKQYNPAEGRVANAGDEELTAKITPPEPWTMAPLPGSTVQAGDMSTYTQAKVEAGTKMLFDDEVWEVVAIGKVWTGELEGMRLLQLRS
jgi:hypothetical protein